MSQHMGGPWVCSENHEDPLVLNRFDGTGHGTPVIDRTFPLHQATEAIQYLIDGDARGKVVPTLKERS